MGSQNLKNDAGEKKIISIALTKKIKLIKAATAILALAIIFLITWKLGASKIKTPKTVPLLKEVEQSIKNQERLKYVNSVKDNKQIPLNGAHEFAFEGKYLYVTSAKENGLLIFDISDPAEPKYINSISDNETTLMKKPHSVLLKNNYAFIGSAGDSAIQILDIADPKNIIPVATLEDNNDIGLKGLHGMGINGNYLYVAGMSDNALEIIDISNPAKPKHTAAIFDDDKLALKAPHSIVFKENYAYIMGADEGIEIMDISNPAKPVHIDKYTENAHGHAIHDAHGAQVVGNYLYTASYADGFGIFDLSDPRKPFQVSEIHPSEENGLMSASDIKIKGDKAFIISEAGNAVVMIDISNPANPQIKDIIKDDGSGNMYIWSGHYLEVIGDYIYAAGMQEGFGVLKIVY